MNFSGLTKKLKTINFASAILYHTATTKWLEKTLVNDKMFGSSDYRNDNAKKQLGLNPKSKQIFISLTRDKNFGFALTFEDTIIRYTFDGRKLNSRHKIILDNDTVDKNVRVQAEEKVIGSIPRLHKYLTKIEYCYSDEHDIDPDDLWVLWKYQQKYGIPCYKSKIKLINFRTGYYKTLDSKPITKEDIDFPLDKSKIAKKLREYLDKLGVDYEFVLSNTYKNMVIASKSVQLKLRQYKRFNTRIITVIDNVVFFGTEDAVSDNESLLKYAKIIKRKLNTKSFEKAKNNNFVFVDNDLKRLKDDYDD